MKGEEDNLINIYWFLSFLSVLSSPSYHMLKKAFYMTNPSFVHSLLPSHHKMMQQPISHSTPTRISNLRWGSVGVAHLRQEEVQLQRQICSEDSKTRFDA
jgi:hypothetical protein